ncbi:putative beta-1,3-galactosyltransferase 6 [Hibiscus syriacus]|uniref:Hexosyltransferase n=1 Tax=Hibiscus syriacus TaxID=106335 RepID=A0A6A3BXX0_HIBSY|nr:putative beta-1,3-galactosyltransferase 6 [Hibiscus syriacus]
MGLSRPQKPGNGISTRWVSLFCIASFFLGALVVNSYQAKCPSLDGFGTEVAGFMDPIVEISFQFPLIGPWLDLKVLVKLATMVPLYGTVLWRVKQICCDRIFGCIESIVIADIRGAIVVIAGIARLQAVHPSGLDGEPLLVILVANGVMNEKSPIESPFWADSNPINMDEEASPVQKHQRKEVHPIVDCDKAGDIISRVSQTHDVIMKLDKTISSLEMQLAAARAAKADNEEGSPIVTKLGVESLTERPKFFFILGIITAFSSRKRRDSIRETWMPRGEELKRLEKEKGIIMRFVIGHSATPGGVLDRAVDAEEEQHKDFLRLVMSSILALDPRYGRFYTGPSQIETRVYIGCMKSGLVLAQKLVKYHEPEYWKFGEEGNKYFRHATGQIYAISKDLATYISVNRHILHRYANEDVSLGSWFIGLNVKHIDDRSLCCGTAPDCEWKAQAGNPCAASFDWSCSGICKSVERMEEVHRQCGEGDGAIWHTSF